MVCRPLPLAVLFALLAVPGAAADMRFIGPAMSAPRVAPEGLLQFTADLSVDCVTVLQAGQGGGTIFLNATLDQPGVVVTGPMSHALDTMACSSATETRIPISLSIGAGQDAPGETPVLLAVSARMESTAVGAPATATTQATFEVEPFFLCQVQLPVTLKMGGRGKDIPYTVEVTNRGNTAITVRSALRDPVADGWQALEPADLVLGSEQQGSTDNAASGIFVVRTPSGVGNEEAIFGVDLTATSARDGVVSTCGGFTVLARGRGYVGTPGPELPMLLGVLALAALARRRA